MWWSPNRTDITSRNANSNIKTNIETNIKKTQIHIQNTIHKYVLHIHNDRVNANRSIPQLGQGKTTKTPAKYKKIYRFNDTLTTFYI